MPRLRQYQSNRYNSAVAVNAEFENVISYINAAEIANLTIRELLEKIFDLDGNVDIGFQLRFDATTGLEFRTAESESEDDWTMVVSAEDIRGEPGTNIGTVEGPLLANRWDFTAAAAQTVFPYPFSEGATSAVVFVNGLLQPESDYIADYENNVLTFGSGLMLDDKVSIYTARDNTAASFVRTDIISGASQVIFAYAHEAEDELQVFRNGILLRPGVGFDYTTEPATGSITVVEALSAGELLSVMSARGSGETPVTGLMLESNYTDVNGLLRYDKMMIGDAGIEQVKVADLETDLAERPRVFVQSTTPTGAIGGDLWINTGGSVPALFFSDGTNWLSSSPNGMVPLPTVTEALKYLRLNSAATALEYVSLDFSSLVALTEIGNPNGVAGLDASGEVPIAQLPRGALDTCTQGTIPGVLDNLTYKLPPLYGGSHIIEGIAAITTAGDCTVQLQIDGVLIGSTLGASGVANDLLFTHSVDATNTPREMALVVSGNNAADTLNYAIKMRGA